MPKKSINNLLLNRLKQYFETDDGNVAYLKWLDLCDMIKNELMNDNEVNFPGIGKLLISKSCNKRDVYGKKISFHRERPKQLNIETEFEDVL